MEEDLAVFAGMKWWPGSAKIPRLGEPPDKFNGGAWRLTGSG